MTTQPQGSTSIVETRRFESASEYLEALRPPGDWSPRYRNWIFRGHGCSEWELLPSAHRKGSLEKYVGFELRPVIGGSQAPPEVQLREGDLLNRLLAAWDEAGLHIPGSDLFGASPPRESMPENHAWPEAWLIPFLALAQHHGLPTRLLDWTRDGRIAAYFAGISTLKSNCRGDDLEVWAMRCEADSLFANNSNRQVNVATVPASSNPNLHAQRGVFTICRGEIFRPDGSVFSLDRMLADLYERQLPSESLPQEVEPPLLKRYRLPRSMGPELLRLLSYDRITAATMFPGRDGVVQGLVEQSYWDEPPSYGDIRWPPKWFVNK